MLRSVASDRAALSVPEVARAGHAESAVFSPEWLRPSSSPVASHCDARIATRSFDSDVSIGEDGVARCRTTVRHERDRPTATGALTRPVITAGLGCDGDTVAITAATHSIPEDILLGAIPRIPRVELHNPCWHTMSATVPSEGNLGCTSQRSPPLIPDQRGVAPRARQVGFPRLKQPTIECPPDRPRSAKLLAP
jgi:hypothetical protein